MDRRGVSGSVKWAGLEWDWGGWSEFRGEVEIDWCEARSVDGRGASVNVDLGDLHDDLYEKICAQAEEQDEGPGYFDPVREYGTWG